MTLSHSYATRAVLLAPVLYLAASLGCYVYHAYGAREFMPSLEVFSPKGLVVGYALGIFFPVGALIALACVVSCAFFVLCRLPPWFLLLPTLFQACLVFYVFNAFRVG